MSFLSQTIMKTYKLILVVLLAACATVPQRPEISGATYDRFHCNYKQAEAGWAKQGNFDLGLGGHPKPATDRHLKTGHQR